MTLADEPQLAGVAGRIADVFAADDERRGAYLDLLVKKGGACSCGTAVCDANLLEHPGVCAGCMKRGRRPDPELLRRLEELGTPLRPPAPPPLKTFTRPAPGEAVPAGRAPSPAGPPPATPAEEDDVAEKLCSNCKTAKLRSDNESGICAACRRAPEKNRAPGGATPKPSTPARSTPPSARGPRVAIAVDLEALEVDELLARRTQLRDDLRAVDAALRARAEKLEEQRKAVLEAVADAA